MRKDIVVLGLGNPLMADEGIGVEVLTNLLRMAHEFPAVEFVDAGTAGLSILHKLSDRTKAIIIDCCLMGTEPGTLAVFTPQDVSSVKRLAHFSLHEVDILHVIELARKLGGYPNEILIFGIEPLAIETKTSLSTVLAERLDGYAERVAEQLRRWL